MGEHKSKPQVFQVELRNIERFSLCDLMLASTVTGRVQERRFSRVFEACALDEYEPLFDTDGLVPPPGDGARVFTLTAENIDYIQDLLERTSLRGRGARRLSPLLNRLEAVKAGEYVAPEATDNGVTAPAEEEKSTAS